MQERRRYFRINETVGIAYHFLTGEENSPPTSGKAPDALELVAAQDREIERLMIELSHESPTVARLIALFNQKLERIVNHLTLESELLGRIAHRIKEANISACGIAFDNDEPVELGARLSLELTLYPSEQHVTCHGIVVDCQTTDEGSWYLRIDFYSMSEQTQETLIKHIVQCQSAQLKKERGH